MKHTIRSDSYWLPSPVQEKKTDPCPFVSRPASQPYPANITFSRLSLDNVVALRLSDKSRVTAAQKEAFSSHLLLAAATVERGRTMSSTPFFLTQHLTFTPDRDKQAGRATDPSSSTQKTLLKKGKFGTNFYRQKKLEAAVCSLVLKLAVHTEV